jgi:hypothetical protein
MKGTKMRQSTVLNKLLYVYQKNGGSIIEKHLKFPYLIKQLLKENNIKVVGNITYFYNGAMVNYILNGGYFLGEIKPFPLNKESKIPSEIENKINNVKSFEKKHFKKEMKKKKKETMKRIYGNVKKNLEEKQRKDYSKKTKEFYSSDEWRRLRYIVLREQGGRCQCCGRSAKDGVILHVDHIIPLSKDWSKRLEKDNLQVLCEDCNLGKSNTDSIDWRK